MSKGRQYTGSRVDAYRPPQWLTDVLQMSRTGVDFHNPAAETSQISDAFRHRCHEAAEVALSIMKLQNERQRIGFVPVSFTEYVHGLAKIAGLSLSAVLSRLGIVELSQPNLSSARAFARLAQELGFSLRETLVHVRIGFAEGLNSAPVSMMVAQRRSGGVRGSQLEECEGALRQLELEYAPKELAEIQRIESEIRATYGA